MQRPVVAWRPRACRGRRAAPPRSPPACRSRGGWWARRAGSGPRPPPTIAATCTRARSPGREPPERPRDRLRSRAGSARAACAPRPRAARVCSRNQSSSPRSPGSRAGVCGSSRTRAAHVDLARVGLERAAQHVQQRALARAVGADQRDAVAAVQRQVERRRRRRRRRRRAARRPAAAAVLGLRAATLNAAGSRGARSQSSDAISRSQPVLAHLGLLRHLRRVALELRRGRAHPARRALGVLPPGATVVAMSASSRRRRLSCASTAQREPLAPPLALLACRPCSRPRRRRARRRESSRTRSTVASRKSRSCETVSSVPVKPASHSASHARPSASRWLVGSSSSSTVGSPSSTAASRQRAASPPESAPSRVPRSRCSMPSRRRASSSRASSAQPPSASKRACASP